MHRDHNCILGIAVNGWHVTPIGQNFGNNYLLRASVAKQELGANYLNEAIYPITFADVTGANLTGANKYTIHFTQVTSVNAFWSLTLYNNKSLFYNNTINRHSLGTYSEGLKKNTDGSVDIYIQHQTPCQYFQLAALP